MTPWDALHARHRDERRDLIATALRVCDGSRSVAAEFLGLQRTYMLRLIRELGVEAAPAPGGLEGKRLKDRARAKLSAAGAASNGSTPR